MNIDERAQALRKAFYSPSGDESELEIIARHMRELIEAEREACAKICEQGIETARIVKGEGVISLVALMEALAETIRARSEKK